MPIQQCFDDDGKSGWQFNDGHCYTGRNARRKAMKDQELYSNENLFAKVDKIITEQAQKEELAKQEENTVRPL